MENYSSNKIKKKLQTLSIWKGNINIEVLKGGWTNDVYLLTDDNKKFVAKVKKTSMTRRKKCFKFDIVALNI